MSARNVIAQALLGFGAVFAADGEHWAWGPSVNRRPYHGPVVGWGSRSQRPADEAERRRKRQRAQKAARKAQRGGR
jgi:hypothetical protein